MQPEASQRWWEGLPPAVGAKPRVSHALPELPLHSRLGAPLQPTCTHAPPTALHPLPVPPCLSVPLPTSVSASLQLSVPVCLTLRPEQEGTRPETPWRSGGWRDSDGPQDAGPCALRPPLPPALPWEGGRQPRRLPPLSLSHALCPVRPSQHIRLSIWQGRPG